MAYKEDCVSEHKETDIKFIRLLERGRSKSLRYRITFKCGCRVLRSRWVWEQKNGSVPDGYVIHHKDHNTMNDDLDNLELMTVKDHLELHGGPVRKTAGIGHTVSEDGKRRISETQKGNQTWLGRKHSEETKKKMSENQKGEKNPMYGTHRTDEEKKHLSDILKGRVSPRKGTKLTDEQKAKISKTLRENPPNKGRKWSDETKKKISDSLLEHNKGKK